MEILHQRVMLSNKWWTIFTLPSLWVKFEDGISLLSVLDDSFLFFVPFGTPRACGSHIWNVFLAFSWCHHRCVLALVQFFLLVVSFQWDWVIILKPKFRDSIRTYSRYILLGHPQMLSHAHFMLLMSSPIMWCEAMRGDLLSYTSQIQVIKCR